MTESDESPPTARASAWVTDNAALVLALALLVSVALGAGAGSVDPDTDLGALRSDTPAARDLATVRSDFSSTRGNVTQMEVLVRDPSGNVLSKPSLLSSLRFQERLRRNATVGESLVADRPTVGIANLVALGATTRNLTLTARRVQRLNATVRQRAVAVRALERRVATDRTGLNETRRLLRAALNETARLDRRYDRLNRSYENHTDPEYEREAAAIRERLRAVRANATAPLDAAAADRFRRAIGVLRSAETDRQRARAYRLANESLRERRAALADTRATLRDQRETLASERERLDRSRVRLAALRDRLDGGFTLAEQRAVVRSLNESELRSILAALLRPDGTMPGHEVAVQLVPADHQPGNTTAHARLVGVRQRTTGSITDPLSVAPDVRRAQLAVAAIADDHERATGAASADETYSAVGTGLLAAELDRSVDDSLWLVAPVAALLMLLTLAVAHRNVLDVALSVVGIGLVLLWTLGVVGWFGVTVTPILVAAPVILVGLSVDYGVHVLARYREQRRRAADGDDGRTPDDADATDRMTRALAAVSVPLSWVTVTTAVGFLSNITTPLPPVRWFGVVSALGIVFAFAVFAGVVPAFRVLIERRLSGAAAVDTTHGGPVDHAGEDGGTGHRRPGTRVLGLAGSVARHWPVAVLAVALVVTLGAGGAATGVETTVDIADYLGDDPPAWTSALPEPVRPGPHTLKGDVTYLTGAFEGTEREAIVLVRGRLTDPGTLDRLDRVDAAARNASTTAPAGPNGRPPVRGLLWTIEEVARENETFYGTVQAADTDGDGVPDRNLGAVYDGLYAAAPRQARAVLDREDGRYRATVVRVTVRDDASVVTVARDARDYAAVVEANDGGSGDSGGPPGPAIQASATGEPVVTAAVSDALRDAVLVSFLVTLSVSLVLLATAYRRAHGSASLGAVTVLPVVLSVPWTVGTMAVVGIPFTALTGMVASLTVGLGVDYSIHVSRRFATEREAGLDTGAALDRALSTTGTALLGSAGTTVAAFGTLALAVVPRLREFGVVVAATIVYAFLASVVVLPALLSVWARYAEDDR